MCTNKDDINNYFDKTRLSNRKKENIKNNLKIRFPQYSQKNYKNNIRMSICTDKNNVKPVKLKKNRFTTAITVAAATVILLTASITSLYKTKFDIDETPNNSSTQTTEIINITNKECEYTAEYLGIITFINLEFSDFTTDK